MAAIDYGAMVFLNGRRVYESYLYPEVQFFDLLIRPYKTRCDITARGEIVKELWGVDYWDDVWGVGMGKKRISAHYTISGYTIHVREICPRVYRMKISHGGNHLTMIYGYGIDNQMKVWNKIKVRYLGKCRAKIVDKELAKAARSFCRPRQNDNGESE